MSEREQFQATLNHENHEGILYYASFTPEVERRLRERLGLSQNADLRDYFGFYYAETVQPRLWVSNSYLSIIKKFQISFCSKSFLLVFS